MEHDDEEWDRWGLGELADDMNIAAIDMADPLRRVVFLPEGGADRPLPVGQNGHTAKTRARNGELFCPIPGCGPFATAVAGQKRHHFRHRHTVNGQRPGHDPETQAHSAAKHRVANWMKSRLGDEIVRCEIDEYRLWTEDRRQSVEPDVYVEMSNGVRIAVEYQHSPGDALDLLRKVKFYDELKITMWWLYGRGPATCRRLSTDSDASDYQKYELTNPQRELLRPQLMKGDYTFHWYDPQDNMIGTPNIYGVQPFSSRPGEVWPECTERPRTSSRYYRRPWPKCDYVSLNTCGLDDCDIDFDSGRLISPMDRAIARDVPLLRQDIRSLRVQARARFQEQLAEQDRRLQHDKELQAEQDRLRQQHQEQQAEQDRLRQAEAFEKALPASIDGMPASHVAPSRPCADSAGSSSHEKQSIHPGVGDRPRATVMRLLKRIGRWLIEPI